MLQLRSALLATFAVLIAETVTAATPVDTCNQGVSGEGYLVGDLDCSSAEQPRVLLLGRAFLDLAGFTFTGEVRCDGASCAINGPGTIVGNVISEGSVSVVNSTVLGFVDATDRISIEQSSITANGDFSAVAARKRIRIRDSMISNPGGQSGVWAKDIYTRGALYGSVVSDASIGVRGGGVLVRIVDSLIVGNDYGVSNGKLKVQRSEVRDNAFVGLYSSCLGSLNEKVVVKDSIIQGNGFSPDCGVSASCADLDLCSPPHTFKESVCDVSHASDSGIPGQSLGVCALD